MKLNKQSRTARLYRYMYDVEELPNNLCPYFWASIAAYPLAILYFILSAPSFIFFRDKETKIVRVLIGLLSYITLTLALCYIHGIYKMITISAEHWNLFPTIGVTLGTFIIGFLFALIYIEEIRQSIIYKRRYKVKEKKQYIAVEYIKAKYNRYCPKIDWE